MEPRQLQSLQLLGVLLLQSGQIARGISLLERAVQLRGDDPQLLANLGNGYIMDHRPAEGLRSYDRALALRPDFHGVLNNRANALRMLGRIEDAAVSFTELCRRQPQFPFAIGDRFHCQRQLCDWDDYETQAQTVLRGVDDGSLIDRPFSILSISDSAARQRRCAEIYAAHLCRPASTSAAPRPRVAPQRIRLAYLSADFREHVMARFMAPLYQRHDRERFEVIGVTLAGVSDDADGGRYRSSFDRWLDLSRMSDSQAAEHLRAQNIDIAVDLMGYTQGCRPQILAAHPAAIQINFLGFPGGTGAPWMDYIIADEFVIPPDAERHYAEKIARLPHSFQLNDPRRFEGLECATPARADAGISPDALVLCAFSNSYKITPEMFALWMRVMTAVPGAVLWLLGEHPPVREHLRSRAIAQGVDPARLVFAERVPYGQHVARLAHADLFLDTLPFNAGATAGDLLWAGVPVITCAAEAFAARMAGSLLRAVDLAELITHDLVQYERLILELACDPARLRALKVKLLAGRPRYPLFDGERYCRDLERAFTEMFQRSLDGQPPRSFTLS